mmetsp:Transcript_7941/g.16655  ORF Transcript_7941/g.16655 Transcript_7941/m.16655 type:complete len:85 (-) Transcript_7941:425-679(-)
MATHDAAGIATGHGGGVRRPARRTEGFGQVERFVARYGARQGGVAKVLKRCVRVCVCVCVTGVVVKDAPRYRTQRTSRRKLHYT